MNATATAPPPTVIDVRTIAPPERHPLIFSTFRSLSPGESIELVVDHEPKPLQARFAADLPGAFAWDAIERGPTTWRVRITRTAAGARHAGGGCCGSCGGG